MSYFVKTSNYDDGDEHKGQVSKTSLNILDILLTICAQSVTPSAYWSDMACDGHKI